MYTPKGELNDKLLELVKNAEIVNALGDCRSPEEGYEVIKKHLQNISLADFAESMAVMVAYLEESKEGTLSEEDLDEIAGGKSSAKTAMNVAAGVGAAAGIGGTAAIVITSLAFTAA